MSLGQRVFLTTCLLAVTLLGVYFSTLAPSQRAGAESSGTVTPTSGALRAGYNTVVWQQPSGAMSSPAAAVAALQPMLQGLAVRVIWLNREGRWLYYLPGREDINTLGSLPPSAALTVILVAELRPNLKPRLPGDLQIEVTTEGRTLLRFTTITWNAGPGPLEVAGRAVAGGDRQPVDQRIYYGDGSYVERNAGSFVYHPEHGHIHFEGFALYVLRRSGTPAEAGRSLKLSSCIADFSPAGVSIPGMPLIPVYNECERQHQGLSVGWLDIYPSDLPGQAIDITGLPDGTYELVVTVDPDQRLLEADEADNTAVLSLELSSGDRTVQVQQPGALPSPTPSRFTAAD